MREPKIPESEYVRRVVQQRSNCFSDLLVWKGALCRSMAVLACHKSMQTRAAERRSRMTLSPLILRKTEHREGSLVILV